MSEPFLGEIRIVAFNFAPNGWAQCNGQLLPISQNTALFSILGTQFGGDGQTTFALPDFRGRAPIHRNPAFAVGSNGGEESHVLGTNEIPSHSHVPLASTNSVNQTSPVKNFWGVPLGPPKLSHAYTAPANLIPLAAIAVGAPHPSGQGHENRSPYLVLNFVIALQGIFPSQN